MNSISSSYDMKSYGQVSAHILLAFGLKWTGGRKASPTPLTAVPAVQRW